MRIIQWLALALFLLLVALIIWVLSLHWRSIEEHQAFNTKLRDSAPGQYLALSKGDTHYHLLGSEQTLGSEPTPVVVLLHDLTSTAVVWESTAQFLAQAGYRVLRYDFFGRGYSARPDVPYVGELFEQQLLELLDGLNIQQPVTLVGLGMGAAIAVRTAANYPQRFNGVALVAPLYQPYPVMTIPVKLGYYMLSAFYLPAMAQNLAKASVPEPDKTRLQQGFQAEKEIRGYTRAVASTLYHFAPDQHPYYYRILAEQETPVLLVWGEADPLLNFAPTGMAQGEEIAAMMRLNQHNFLIIKEAGAYPHLEQAARFNQQLLYFLRGL